jgi:hypothetical protein
MHKLHLGITTSKHTTFFNIETILQQNSKMLLRIKETGTSFIPSVFSLFWNMHRPYPSYNERIYLEIHAFRACDVLSVSYFHCFFLEKTFPVSLLTLNCVFLHHASYVDDAWSVFCSYPLLMKNYFYNLDGVLMVF